MENGRSGPPLKPSGENPNFPDVFLVSWSSNKQLYPKQLEVAYVSVTT